MKSLYLLIILLSAPSIVLAAVGHEVSGIIGVGGLFKRLIVPDAIPVGSIDGTFGYEVLDFSKDNKNFSKPVYCQGGLVFNLNTSVIGVNFGGQTSRIQTFGQCEEPIDYTGGFLQFDLTYNASSKSPKSSWQSVGFGASVSFGFSMQKFVDELMYSFHTHNRSNFSATEKVARVNRHLMRYVAKATLSSNEKLMVKILTMLFTSMHERSELEDIAVVDLDESEAKRVKEFGTNPFDLKSAVWKFLDHIKKDASFYECGKVDSCVDLCIDVMNYLEAFHDSIGTCHSFALTIAPNSSFHLSLTKRMKISAGIGYKFFHLEKEDKSDKSTQRLANKYFLGHNFNYRSKQCLDAASTASSELGQLIPFMKKVK